MKKAFILLLTMVLVFSLLILPASAEANGENAKIQHVLDKAGLLTQNEIDTLEEKASVLSEKNSCSVYIIALDNYGKYSSSMKQCAQDLYEEFNLGWNNGNENRDLVMLLISLSDRDYTIYTNGKKGNEIFNNAGITNLENHVVPSLRNNDWYGAFSEFLREAESLFISPLEDNLDAVSPYTTETYGYEQDSSGGINPFSVFITIFVPCLISLAICNVMKKKMVTAVPKTNADGYIQNNGVRMTNRQDVMTNRTVQRQIIRQPVAEQRTDNTFSGGTGGHYSGGPSGHSGKF